MGKRGKWAQAFFLVALVFFFGAAMEGAAQVKSQQKLESNKDRNERLVQTLSEEVRHQLVMMPYYSVFDWLQAEVKADGTVQLMGQVTRPTIKSDAESSVKRLEAVSRVMNNIEVLPLSPADEQLRVALYRAIYNSDSPLFRYAMQSIPPIHIIVKNGRATLKGVVASQMDSQLAYVAARGVPGLFDVQNELQVEAKT